MPMPARAQRLARGWLVGLVATTVAAVSHSLAGGYRPALLSWGLALVFAGLLGTAVIRRRPSLPRLAIAVGVSQLAFHVLFSTLGTGADVRVMPGMGGGMPGMGGGFTPTISAVAMPGHDHLADPAMWIAHTVAAALTIVFLRHAELALWGMLARVVSRLVARPIPASSTRAPEAPGERPIVARLSSRLLVASASRRGPPLLAF